MPKILVVDDEKVLVKGIKFNLENEGYQVEVGYDGQEAVEQARTGQFDLIILDLMMPKIDGLQACMKIREFSNVPVIMLTARGEEYDRLLGFRLGADDYVPKPFSPKELMARVHAVLKRAAGPRHTRLTFGELTIEPEARAVTLGDRPVSLPPKEFDLLLTLAENERMVFSREQLLDRVWGYDYFGDVRTVDTHIKSLREHLGAFRRAIKTVWGVGYKFEYQEGS